MKQQVWYDSTFYKIIYMCVYVYRKKKKNLVGYSVFCRFEFIKVMPAQSRNQKNQFPGVRD